MADTSKQEEYYNNGGPIRTDQLHNNDTHESVLEKVRTAGSVSIPPELFEKLYLSPETRVHGDLRRTIGNPTPMYVLHLNIPDKINCSDCPKRYRWLLDVSDSAYLRLDGIPRQGYCHGPRCF